MTDIATELRHLLTDNRSVSLMRTNDGRWQANVRRRSDGHAYGVTVDDDPVGALEKLFRIERQAPAPQPAPDECETCADTGWQHGEFGVPCGCGRREFNRVDLFGPIFEGDAT